MYIPYANYVDDEYLDNLAPYWPHLTNSVTSLADGSTQRYHLALILSAAYCCGWTPAWTQPPQDFDGSAWTGAYIAHQKPIVTTSDAQAMALAVEKALPRLTAASEACAQSLYLYCCFYGLLTAHELVDDRIEIGMPTRYPQHLDDLLPVEGACPIFQDGAQEIHAFIALCRQGAFFIEG